MNMNLIQRQCPPITPVTVLEDGRKYFLNIWQGTKVSRVQLPGDIVAEVTNSEISEHPLLEQFIEEKTKGMKDVEILEPDSFYSAVEGHQSANIMLMRYEGTMH